VAECPAHYEHVGMPGCNVVSTRTIQLPDGQAPGAYARRVGGLMFYSAIVTICSLAVPTDCLRYEVQLPELSPNPSAAFIEAQGYVAQWMLNHPRYRFEAMTLQPGRGA
jgi:hypothetical protein